MPNRPTTAKPRLVRASRLSLTILTVGALWVFLMTGSTALGALSQPAPVGLGTAGSFAILAGSGITNTGESTILGNVGSHPNGATTGFGGCPAANCVNLTGTNYHDNPPTPSAKGALVTAYDDAAGRPCDDTDIGDLGGKTLTAGVYCFTSTAGWTGQLTLDAENVPGAVFIFKIGSGLTTASASDYVMSRGAQACNVFWKVTSSATLGSGSDFVGTIMALTSITVADGVTIDGRLLARNADVTLIHDTITRPTCQAPIVTTTNSSTSTSRSTTTSTTTSSSSATSSSTSTVTSSSSSSSTGSSTTTVGTVSTSRTSAGTNSTSTTTTATGAAAIVTSTSTTNSSVSLFNGAMEELAASTSNGWTLASLGIIFLAVGLMSFAFAPSRRRRKIARATKG